MDRYHEHRQDCPFTFAPLDVCDCVQKNMAGRIEALEARVAAADKLAGQAQMVKDFRYDPNIGVQLNFLEEALAAYQDTKEQGE